MGKHTKVWHYCDDCGSADTHHLTHASTEVGAIRQAQEHGWVFKGKKAYCPDCYEKLLAKH